MPLRFKPPELLNPARPLKALREHLQQAKEDIGHAVSQVKDVKKEAQSLRDAILPKIPKRK